MNYLEADVLAVQAIEVVPTILKVICESTGMRFAAVARVTEERWIACQVLDRIGFGLVPGGELELESTICNEVRNARTAVYIDHVAQDVIYCSHATPARYGFESYVSEPIVLRDGTFFGTLCAIDPAPAKVDDEKTHGTFKLFAQLIAFHLQASERWVAGEAIRRSAAFTESVLVASPDVIKVLSADGVIEYTNQTGRTVDTRYGEEVHLGEKLVSTWPESEQAKVRAAIEQAKTGVIARIEGYRPSAAGDPGWWEASFTSFGTERGDTKIVCISREITDRIQAEAMSKEATRGLAELNEKLEQRVLERTKELASSQEALRQAQKMEAVGQLTGGLAHDFNNLLTGITGSLELLQMRTAQGRYGEIERYVGAAQGAARRAAALTHRLLAFSRRQTLDPKSTDVNRLVADMADLLRRTVGPHVAIKVVGAGGLWPTLIDPNQLESALLNLCINARDSMPHGGQITIETANRWIDDHAGRERDLSAGQYISLCVTDTGTGMTPDVVERAFDPFFTTKPLGEGTGLGLSMVYGFARQSGGQVRIYSEVGIGTTMCLYLPRDSDAFAQDVSPQTIERAQMRGTGEVVLVVDDEPTIRMLITEVLDQFGYASIEAVDGPSGLQVLQTTTKIDLLVTDVGLPGGLNGRQLADAARVLRPSLKVLFITGYAENAVIGDGHLGLGMQVLTKPFALDVLAQRIRAMVEM